MKISISLIPPPGCLQAKQKIRSLQRAVGALQAPENMDHRLFS
jgi:hypothetical protein